MFLLGMLSQRADAVDAIVGLVVSLAFIAYLLACSAVCTDASPSKPCANGTEHHFVMPAACHHVLLVARLSQWLYAAVGSAVCFFAGLLSALVRGQVKASRATAHPARFTQPLAFRPSQHTSLSLGRWLDRSLGHLHAPPALQVPPASKIVGFTWWTRTISMRGVVTDAGSYGVTPLDSAEEKKSLLEPGLPPRAEVGRVN